MTSKVLQNPTAQQNISVTKEDQSMINTFSRLNNRKHELEDEIKEVDNELMRIADAKTMIYMSDEVRLHVGDSFALSDLDEAEQVLDEKDSALQQRQKAMKDEMALVQSRMAELKAKLYAKFGRSINLEED